MVSVLISMSFRWVLSKDMYIKLNKFIMSIVFFVPLSMIALFESRLSKSHSDRLNSYFAGPAIEEEGDPKIEDPSSEDDPNGDISKFSFADLCSKFPK